LFDILKDDSKRAAWLRFTTGFSGLPLGGLEDLSPPISISVVSDETRLPTARTCFNQFFMPLYQKREDMERALDFILAAASTMED
jgi:hypothetical protein